MAIIKKTEGHLTITDLTDVADVYFEYALALKNALVTNEYTFNETGEIGWSKAYPTWNPGYQIWKRQVKLTERAEQEQYVFQTSATTTYTDGAYVRVHGYDIEKNYVEQLYQFLIRPDTVVPLIENFNLSSNIQFIRISYPKTGLNNTSFVQGDTSPISGTGLIDINTNEDGSIITGGNSTSNSSFTHTDYIPVCIVTYGTPNLDTAVNQINNSITNINSNLINLDTKLETFFWPGDPTYSGAFGVAKTAEDRIDYTNANTYGFNTRVATGLVSIGYNKIPLSEWGINEGLKMYYPILDNEKVVGHKPGMQLFMNSLTFYKANNSSDKALEINTNGINLYRDNNNKAVEINTNGINLYGSSTTTTDATLTVNGLVLTKGGVTAGTHSSIEAQDIVTFEYVQGNIAINALTANLEIDMDGRESVDIIHTNKNIAILPPSLLNEPRTHNGVTWTATSNSSYHVEGTATAASGNAASRDYDGKINGNMRFLPKGTYTITATKTGTGGGYVYLRGFTPSNTTYRILVSLSRWNTPQTFTLEEDAFYLLNTQVSSGATVDYDVTIQIEKGTAGTAYIENQYELKTISLGQKVYKGILEVKSGTLTITHQIFDVNFVAATGTQAGGSATNYKGFYSSVIPNVKKPANQEVPDMYCNRLTVTSRYDNYRNTEGIAIHQTEGRAYVYSTDISSMTLEEARAWLEDNPIQIVYPLETPQIIRLGPTNITNFENINNIWSNSGTIALERGDLIYLSTEDFGSCTINGSTSSDWREIIGANFGIRADGSLYAVNANINGTIHAIDGEFTGTIHAINGDFEGSLNAKLGFIGSWSISDKGLIYLPPNITDTSNLAQLTPFLLQLVNEEGIVSTSFTEDSFQINNVISWSSTNNNNLLISTNDIQVGGTLIKNTLNTYNDARIDAENGLKNRIEAIEAENLIKNKFITINEASHQLTLKRIANTSASTIDITDTQIKILLNNNVITTYKDNLAHTTFGEFENLRMRVGNKGNLTWVTHSDGRLSLKIIV